MSVLTDYYPHEAKQRLDCLVLLWEFAKTVEPLAAEGLSYGLPALKLNDRPLIGFSVAKKHMSVYPFSPKVIEVLKNDLTDFEVSKGVIRFTATKPVPQNIIKAMILLRKYQLQNT